VRPLRPLDGRHALPDLLPVGGAARSEGPQQDHLAKAREPHAHALGCEAFGRSRSGEAGAVMRLPHFRVAVAMLSDREPTALRVALVLIENALSIKLADGVTPDVTPSQARTMAAALQGAADADPSMYDVARGLVSALERDGALVPPWPGETPQPGLRLIRGGRA
jgi:hypothetical protein